MSGGPIFVQWEFQKEEMEKKKFFLNNIKKFL